jgi:hypothetical protein
MQRSHKLLIGTAFALFVGSAWMQIACGDDSSDEGTDTTPIRRNLLNKDMVAHTPRGVLCIEYGPNLDGPCAVWQNINGLAVVTPRDGGGLCLISYTQLHDGGVIGVYSENFKIDGDYTELFSIRTSTTLIGNETSFVQSIDPSVRVDLYPHAAGLCESAVR